MILPWRPAGDDASVVSNRDGQRRAGASSEPRGRALAWAVAATVGLGLSLFLFYFPVYRLNGFDSPVGFDAPWYVWRGEFVASEGIGPLGTAIRPGHAVLTALMGALTGRSQLQLAVVLPLVLVSVFALSVGALCRRALATGALGSAVAVGVSGTLAGATRLVGENVANLLFLALVVAAVASLASWIGGERGFWGALAMMVAAGLAHWVFLAVLGAMLVLAFLLALPGSLRDRRRGIPPHATEAGKLAILGGAVGGAMALSIGAFLRAPFQTFEIREDPARFLPKLRNDLDRMAWPVVGPLAIAGAIVLARRRPRAASGDASDARRRAFAHRFLLAWTLVSAGGLAYGALTLDLPPHRFLALLVAVPVAVALTGAVVLASDWLASRVGRIGAVAGAILAVALLAVPGGMAWYRENPGVWLEPEALRQATIAAEYVEALPEGEPVVFVVGPFGRAGLLSVPLKERTIRVPLAAERQDDAYFFVGDPDDFLAGRRSLAQGERTNEATLPYWIAVRPILERDPLGVILRSLAPQEFERSLRDLAASEIGPGVAVLRPPPGQPATVAGSESADLPPVPSAVPTIELGVLWALAVLAALGVAGAGWAVVFLGRRPDPVTFAFLAPAAGAAMLILGGVVVARAGVGMGGPAGVATFAVVALAGYVSAWSSMRGKPIWSRAS
jgi:hypothetical protein